MITARTIAVFVVMAALGVALFAFSPTANAWYWCGGAAYGNPDDCWRDSDCDPGVCSNRQCKCGSDIENKPICGDRCADRGYVCTTGNCTTRHVTDCRGIATGDRGGVISYCGVDVCSPSTGQSCTRTNSCGMSNTGTILCNGSCSVSAPPESACGNPPTGNFDAADCSAARGWSSDPDYSGPVSVHIYRDGPAGGGGTFAAAVTANQFYPGRGNVGWSWTVPSALKNGIAHPVYAYAINVGAGGSPQGPNPLLSGSPKSITCTEPPVGSLTAASCGSASGTANDPQGSPVAVTLWDGPVGTGTQLGSGPANPNFTIGFAPFTNGQIHSVNASGTDIPSGIRYQLTGTVPVACTPIVTLNANPATVDFGGASTLTWSYTNGTTCTSSPGGWFNPPPGIPAANGSGNSGPLTSTTVFTLNCTNAAGQSATATRTVSVNIPPPVGTITNVTDTDYCTAVGMNIDWRYESPSRPIGAYQVQVLRGGQVVFDTGKTSYTALESEFEDDGVAAEPAEPARSRFTAWLAAALSSFLR